MVLAELSRNGDRAKYFPAIEKRTLTQTGPNAVQIIINLNILEVAAYYS